METGKTGRARKRKRISPSERGEKSRSKGPPWGQEKRGPCAKAQTPIIAPEFIYLHELDGVGCLGPLGPGMNHAGARMATIDRSISPIIIFSFFSSISVYHR